MNIAVIMSSHDRIYLNRYKKSNEDLKEKTQVNSKNSSLPSSMDMRKAKSIKKKISNRKQGAQPGHKGIGRKLLPESSVNQIINCMPPDTCDDCEGAVQIKKFRRHQVYEIPVQHFEVIEYRKHRGICLGCAKKHEGQYPVGVGSKMLGHKAHALVGLLTSKYRMSKRLVVDMFKDIYGLSLSVGTISNTEEVVSDALSSTYDAIQSSLKSAPVVHLDETGHKEKNKNGWAWVMGNELFTLFALRRSRGKKIARELIGNHANRIFITDRYGAYDYLPDVNRQVCWAHLKRDFQKISERDGPSGRIGTGLLKAYCKLFRLWKFSTKERRLYHKKTQQWFRRFRRRIINLLHRGATCTNKNTARTCQNLLSIAPALWTFWERDNVPPTNNQAERQLRPLVISKKLTFGTQSDRGSRFIERVFTSVMSCKQQKVSIFTFLHDCVSALFQNQPAPVLVSNLQTT